MLNRLNLPGRRNLSCRFTLYSRKYGQRRRRIHFQSTTYAHRAVYLAKLIISSYLSGIEDWKSSQSCKPEDALFRNRRSRNVRSTRDGVADEEHERW